jgi:hypothetical protein
MLEQLVIVCSRKYTNDKLPVVWQVLSLLDHWVLYLLVWLSEMFAICLILFYRSGGYRVKGGIKLWCVRCLGQCLWQFGMWCWIVLWKCTDSSKESCLHHSLSSALVTKTIESFEVSVHIYQIILFYNPKKSGIQEMKSLSYVRYAKMYLGNNSVKLQL